LWSCSIQCIKIVMDIFECQICSTFRVWLNSCLHDLFSYLKSGGIWDRTQNLNHFYDPAISILVDYFKMYSVKNTTKFQSYKIPVDIVTRLWDGQLMNRVSILGRDRGFFLFNFSVHISCSTDPLTCPMGTRGSSPKG
jgi:hypothetical protein